MMVFNLIIIQHLSYHNKKIYIAIHVIPPLVVKTLNAVTITVLHLAHAYRIIWVLLQIVDLNVWLILNVQATKLVSMKNVETLAQGLVESMQNVTSLIILLFVHVMMVTKGTHLHNANLSLPHVRFFNLCKVC
jgi:hypothetical protein